MTFPYPAESHYHSLSQILLCSTLVCVQIQTSDETLLLNMCLCVFIFGMDVVIKGPPKASVSPSVPWDPGIKTSVGVCLLPIAVIKAPTKSSSWGEGLSVSHIPGHSPLKEATAGSKGSRLEANDQRPGRSAARWLASHRCPACFLRPSWVTCLGVASCPHP